MSQPELGRLVGKQGQQIWKYENGRNLPGPDVLVGLAAALRVTERWLLWGEDEHLERDDELGHPAIEAFLERKAATGEVVADDHAQALRSLRRSMGPDSITDEVLEGMLRGLRARDARRNLERPLAPEAKVDTDRGQRALPPKRRRR